MSVSILLIEDNEQNRYLATYLLEHHGFIVSTAGDGPSGIKMAREIIPDLILLDIQLPGMDGYEVARHLRKEERLKTTPIVALTSYAMPGDREKALDSGCNGYFEKPLQPETFIGEIQHFLPPLPDASSSNC